MQPWVLTLDFNGGEYEIDITVWADAVRQCDEYIVIADNVMIVLDCPLLKPPYKHKDE